MLVLNPQAIFPGFEFRCCLCEQRADYEEVIEAAVAAAYFGENYVDIKDGGDGVTSECESCDRDAYLWSANMCLCCGYKPNICASCGAYFGRFCEYCDAMDGMGPHG
jgi:hypothetical protein